jgi:SAM-dependent methyltransferase
MRREDWSTIAHRGLEPMGPYDMSHIDLALRRLGDSAVFAAVPGTSVNRVIDVGCGSGHVLAYLAGSYGMTGVGVDIRPVARTIPGIDFVQADAETFGPPDEAFGLALSIGSVAGPERLAELIRPGGSAIWGTGFWLAEPAPAYLAALGAIRDEMADLAGTLQAGRDAGLEPLEPVLSTVDDWDRYEDAWYRNGAAYAAKHAGEPGVEEFTEWIDSGRRRYRQLGGRGTLGFGLFPFVLPSAPAD